MFSILFLTFVLSTASGALVNTAVSRQIDLTTHLCTVITTVTAKNTGSTTATSYAVPTDPRINGTLAFTSVQVIGGSEMEIQTSNQVTELFIHSVSFSVFPFHPQVPHSLTPLTPLLLPLQIGDGDINQIESNSAAVEIKAGQSVQLQIVQIYIHSQSPYPQEYVCGG